MARKNNKGFSIVEIVIAIAILSVLLVPIVTQIGQTFRTSRQTKLQQLSNDDAIYLMEDFQRSSLDELDAKYGNAVDGDTHSAQDVIKKPAQCEIFDETGSSTGVVVNYNVRIYKIDDVTLGHEKTNYSRTVILDDLSMSLLDAGYKMTVNSVEKEGFTVNDEGNTIQTDSDGLITAALCTTQTAVENPNKINLGNMQNMDSTQVAIIAGNATNFDAQAESDFYALAMNKLKEEDFESWQQAMYQSDSDSVLNQYYNLDNTKKVTRVYIDQLTDSATSEKYYQVNVEVTYKNSSVTDPAGRWSDELTYNVYSQKFYMDECPAVYFEYQPYTAEASTGNFIYAESDYIIVENYVEDASIYLCKPVADQRNVYTKPDPGTSNVAIDYYDTGKTGAVEDDDGVVLDKYGNVESYKFYRYIDNNVRTQTVNIYIAKEKDTKKATIYTNIYLDEFKKQAFNVFDMPKTAETASGTHEASVSEAFDGDIKKLSEDERLQDRIFTIRVSLEPDDTSAHSVSLTGAKGEN